VRHFEVEEPVEEVVEEEVFQSVKCTASLGIILTQDPSFCLCLDRKNTSIEAVVLVL